MTNKKFVVKLSGEERGRLNELISKGKAKAKTILKARILLKADQAKRAWADEEICRALDTNVTMVARVREKLVTEGLEAVLARKKRDTPPARRLVERFEWHYTPKHGSWPNMAESELAILSNQCLNRRIPDRRSLERQVVAWLRDRNIHNVKADWRFKTADAHIKLKCLYPALLLIQATGPWGGARRGRRRQGRSWN